MKKKIYIKLIFKIIKFVFITLLILFSSLYLSLYIILNKYFSKNDINYIVTGHIQDLTQRAVRIGNINFNLDGNIKIKNISIYEKDLKTYFTKSDYVLIKYNPRKLIKGIFEIKSIKLISPEINLIRNKQGEWNFYDIVEKIRKSNNKSNIKLTTFEIEDGKINIEDKKKQNKHTLNNINLQTGNIKLSEPINFSISTFFKSPYLQSKEQNRFFMEGIFIPFPEKNEFNIKDIKSEISINDIDIIISGNISNSKSINATLNIKIPEINLKKIFKIPKDIFIPKSDLNINILKENENYIINGFIDSIKTSFKSIISEEKDTFLHKTYIEVNKINIEKIYFLIEKFIRNPKGEINIKLNLNGILTEKPEKINIESSFSNLSFSDNYEIIEFKDAYGKFVNQNYFSAFNIINTSAKLKNNLIKNMSLKWEWEGNNEIFNSIMLLNNKKLKIIGKIYRNNEKIKKSQFMVYNQITDFNEIMNIINFCQEKINNSQQNKNKSKNYDFNNSQIELFYKSNSIKSEYGESERLYHYSNINSFSTKFDGISGNFKTKILNGKFYNIQQNADKNNVYYIISLPITILYRLNRLGALKIKSELKELYFSEIGADYTLNNGKIIINSFYINSKDFLAYTTGEIDFKNEKLDLKVYTINNKYYAIGGLPEALTDAKGKPAIAFNVKGKFKKNDIKILDPNYNANIIHEAINKGINIDTKKMDSF